MKSQTEAFQKILKPSKDSNINTVELQCENEVPMLPISISPLNEYPPLRPEMRINIYTNVRCNAMIFFLYTSKVSNFDNELVKIAKNCKLYLRDLNLLKKKPYWYEYCLQRFIISGRR